MNLKSVGRVMVGMVVAVLAVGTMSGVLGMTPEENFYDCMENTSGDAAARERCCAYAGGSWVEIYDDNGDVIDAFCDGAEEVAAGSQPTSTSTGTKSRTTSGTYSQPTSTASPTRTGTTSGTYYQQPTSTTYSGSTSGTTSTTSSR